MQTPAMLRAVVIRILTPLVRVLLREGMSFSTFADVAKEVFVQVAASDFTISGRKQSISRISVLTGLHRKAVKLLLDQSEDKNAALAERYNRAARVIAGWRRDPQFQTTAGLPAEIPIDGTPDSFTALVKKYSGDVPARAVLDELVRTASVARKPDGHIRLLTRSYVPVNDDQMKLYILGTDTGDLIATITHNLDHQEGQPFFQRKVSYDNLPLEAVDPFREMASNKSQSLLEDLDRYLSEQDRDHNSEVTGKGRVRAGIGIYYFEEIFDDGT
jgi:hypothetical protein